MERRALGDPGVDDQHVDRAVGGARFVEGAVDAGAVGDVALDRRADTILPAISSSGSRRRPSSEILAPAAWRWVGRRGADAGAAAGDQRMAPFEPVCQPSLSPFTSSIGRRLRRWQGEPNSSGKRLMKTRAAVAFEAKQPLEIVELDLEGPKAGEVLVEIMATGICHTDAYTLDGLRQRGHLPLDPRP